MTGAIQLAKLTIYYLAHYRKSLLIPGLKACLTRSRCSVDICSVSECIHFMHDHRKLETAV